jgi:hypothetical protein
MRSTRLPALVLAFVAAALLAGCASTYRVDSTVQSYSGLPALPASPTYRFERLPSQQAAPDQARIEALADPALFKAGLRRDDANPRYSVQVSARVSRTVSTWAADPWGGWGWYPGWYGPRGPWGWGPPLPPSASTWWQREVQVIVRQLPDQKVVFESRAFSETYYLNNDEVLTAMFDAALAGFPNPPSGPRRVNVEVTPPPRGGAAAPASPAPAAPVTPAAPVAPAR